MVDASTSTYSFSYTYMYMLVEASGDSESDSNCLDTAAHHELAGSEDDAESSTSPPQPHHNDDDGIGAAACRFQFLHTTTGSTPEAEEDGVVDQIPPRATGGGCQSHHSNITDKDIDSLFWEACLAS